MIVDERLNLVLPGENMHFPFVHVVRLGQESKGKSRSSLSEFAACSFLSFVFRSIICSTVDVSDFIFLPFLFYRVIAVTVQASPF